MKRIIGAVGVFAALGSLLLVVGRASGSDIGVSLSPDGSAEQIDLHVAPDGQAWTTDVTNQPNGETCISVNHRSTGGGICSRAWDLSKRPQMFSMPLDGSPDLVALVAIASPQREVAYVKAGAETIDGAVSAEAVDGVAKNQVQLPGQEASVYSVQVYREPSAPKDDLMPLVAVYR